MTDRPDIVVIMTDEERATPPYEAEDVLAWRQRVLADRPEYVVVDKPAGVQVR